MEHKLSAPTVGAVKIDNPVAYCLYARKSSEDDERQALSIDSQIKEMLLVAQRENLHVKEIRKESHSTKASGTRPVYNQLMTDLKSGLFNGILTWAPDRLSRNAGDLGSLVDLMDQKLLHEIRTHGQMFTNSPNEKFLLMILCSQAKLENDNKSINVKRGLKTRVEMGLWPCVAPTGYLNEMRSDRKGYIMVDPLRGPVIKQMFEKMGLEQWSGRRLYSWLKHEIKFKTRGGTHLTLSSIYRILQNPFYYGTFQYPVRSGNWYTGKHKPIITKDLYDKAQEWMKRMDVVRSESKEFAFTKLMTCGLCGSGITAQEKFKKLKKGGVNRYVYYNCTRARDMSCKALYINENELVDQLVKMIDQISLDELGLKNKIREEIERYHKFQYKVLKMTELEQVKQKEIDIKNYAKYILTEGTVYEKREMLSCLKSRLMLKDKQLILGN